MIEIAISETVSILSGSEAQGSNVCKNSFHKESQTSSRLHVLKPQCLHLKSAGVENISNSAHLLLSGKKHFSRDAPTLDVNTFNELAATSG